MRTPGLTEQELTLASMARFDLGSGYPQIQIPQFIRSIFKDERLEDLGLMTAPVWTAEKQDIIMSDLADSVRRALCFEFESPIVRTTFSGSVAVDRAIVACLRRARKEGYHRLEVVTTSPSIDIMRDLLTEHSDVDIIFSEGDSKYFPILDVDQLLFLINAPLPSGSTRAILLTSPENPTGAIWSSDDLRAIARSCEDRGYSLVVDHCFYIAGVHEMLLPAVWQYADVIEHWIGIWDTGKTFGLNGEKLGFLMCSPSFTTLVDDALRVLQFDVSRRQILLFTELLRVAPFYDYISNLRTICQTNYASLEILSTVHSLDSLRPAAGTLALFNIKPLGVSDSQFQEMLLASNVGVITGSVFFHGALQRHDLVRIALARDPVVFAAALERIDVVLSKMRSMLQ